MLVNLLLVKVFFEPRIKTKHTVVGRKPNFSFSADLSSILCMYYQYFNGSNYFFNFQNNLHVAEVTNTDKASFFL